MLLSDAVYRLVSAGDFVIPDINASFTCLWVMFLLYGNIKVVQFSFAGVFSVRYSISALASVLLDLVRFRWYGGSSSCHPVRP